MMPRRRRTRTRLVKIWTAAELRKKSKRFLIRLILRLQARLLRRRGIRRSTRRRARTSSHRRGRGRRLRAGTHWVTIRGRRRKVRVLRNGRWRFLRGKAKGTRRKARRRRR